MEPVANERARWLRRNRTDAERKLWLNLRGLKAQGHKFRQQASIDHYVVDFVCLAQRLIIEVDGATYGTEAEIASDAARERYLISQGFRVVRYTNEDVRSNLAGVMDSIVANLADPHP